MHVSSSVQRFQPYLGNWSELNNQIKFDGLADHFKLPYKLNTKPIQQKTTLHILPSVKNGFVNLILERSLRATTDTFAFSHPSF